MAYWIQSMGSPQNGEDPNRKLFYAETEADILHLPTQKTEGIEQANDMVAHKKCPYGSSCLCLETSHLYVLSKESDAWLKV